MKRTTRTAATACPVLALAFEYDVLTRAYADMDMPDADLTALGPRVIMARLDAINMQASFMRPTCNDGAAFQIMVANSLLDTVRRGTSETLRQEAASTADRLLRTAAGYLSSGDNRMADASEYLMGSHIDPHTTLAEIMTGVQS